MKNAIVILLCVLPALTLRAQETGRPEDIPNAGRIRIDGRLQDWRRTDWTPLDQTLDGIPETISNARWSLYWNDDPAVYIAVQYTDAELALQDSYINSNAQDCVEIYVRGDTGSSPLDYSQNQDSAQRYIIGLSQDRLTSWMQLGAFTNLPNHNSAKAAVTLEGNMLTYEIKVPLYDRFDATSRHRTSETEVQVDLEIGVDIAIIDVSKNGYTGIQSENRMSGKRTNADRIAIHRLGE